MTSKPEARLTSTLLARKGNAQPFSAVDIFSLPPQAAVTQNAGTDERATGGRPRNPWPPSPAKLGTATDKSENAPQASQPARPKVVASGTPKSDAKSSDAKSSDSKSTEDPSSCEKRVALTLRVDQDRHMRLKLLSVKTRRSSQEVLLAALDTFLDQAAEDIEFCKCLRPISMCNGAK